MSLQVKINETVDISNRELIKGIEALEEKKPEDYYWLKDRLSLMKTFSEEVWHFKTAALKLSKRELKDFEMLDLLKECNKIQNTLLKKLNKI